ncbi:MAG TPA: hypothetical protein VJ623_08550 [Holophagaceae bacterium]|nr:hypothetical protein [Holophagaceae bacterium]
MRQDTIISETRPTADLKAPGALKEGDNVMFKEAGTGSLVAVVKKGTIEGWRAFDAKGVEVPTVLIRQPEPEVKGALKARRRRGKTIVRICACFPTGDRCWWESW